MEYIQWLFVTCWDMLCTPITLFGYSFSFALLLLFSMIIGFIGMLINGLSD